MVGCTTSTARWETWCSAHHHWGLQAAEFWGLGLQQLPVSAISGSGTGDMMDALVATLPAPRQPPQTATAPSKEEPIAVAILGRPNVGKSSLLNSLVQHPVYDLSHMHSQTVQTGHRLHRIA